MESHYRIIKDKNLLIYRCTGIFTIGEYKDLVIKVTNDPDWQFVTKILSDYRDCKSNTIIDSIDELHDIRKFIIKKELRNVFLINSPSGAASAHLYITDAPITSGYSYCTTLKHALEILALSSSYNEIEAFLKSLERLI
jgi:hypothetical protein